MVAQRKRGPVEQGIWRELDPKARRLGLAQAALELARRVDAGPEDREAAVLVRELRASLVELRRRVSPPAGRDQVDEIRARREARRGA